MPLVSLDLPSKVSSDGWQEIPSTDGWPPGSKKARTGRRKMTYLFKAKTGRASVPSLRTQAVPDSPRRRSMSVPRALAPLRTAKEACDSRRRWSTGETQHLFAVQTAAEAAGAEACDAPLPRSHTELPEESTGTGPSHPRRSGRSRGRSASDASGTALPQPRCTDLPSSSGKAQRDGLKPAPGTPFVGSPTCFLLPNRRLSRALRLCRDLPRPSSASSVRVGCCSLSEV